MTDEGVFKQRRNKVTAQELGEDAAPVQHTPESEQFVNPLDRIRQVQEIMAEEEGVEVEKQPARAASSRPLHSDPDAPFQIQGRQIPEAFRRALQSKGNDVAAQSETPPPPPRPASPPPLRAVPDQMVNESRMRGTGQGSEALAEALGRIMQHNDWEALQLPSKGKFYDSIPAVLHIRPMSGEEEQILATPRNIRKGTAIDMIFKNCIRENIDTSELLSVDRTYLLIYLRGISYTPEYDVEIKCVECGNRFNTVIDLNSLEVEPCPEDFTREHLQGTLPTTGLAYRYRLASGEDEREVTRHRDMLLKEYGDKADDDTLLFRTSLLLESVERVVERHELGLLLKKLPINDVAHLRNVINDPPFGVNTEVGMICPSCDSRFEVDLPLEASFFFPRKKDKRTRP